MNALKGLATKTTKSSSNTKSKIITLSVLPVQKAEDMWVKANQQISEGKANKELAERAITEYAEPQWMKTCRENGVAENSCTVGRVRLTFKGKSQFAAKTSLDADRLRSVFGDNDYEKYFTEKEGPMQLSPEAVANPIIVQKLSEAIASIANEFPDTQIITYDSEVVPKDTLFNDWVLRADIHDNLEAKLAAAGVQRTKTTFAGR